MSEPVPHVVGVGASAGGLEAIEAFFTHMPVDSGCVFIVIQHLSPDYKSLMVELLSKKTPMPVSRAEDGVTVEANHVYLIPPKHHLTIFHGKLLLSKPEPTRGVNLPIDVFLRSLAEDQGDRSVAIILSGTGSDGTRGVRAVKEYGGMVMVQDEESSKFDGMPRAAISTGLADFILPPDQMPEQLLSYIKHPRLSLDEAASGNGIGQDALTRIFAALRDKTNVDFTYYKQTTISRRIERRMTINQLTDLDEYVSYLRSYPGEVHALHRELLIGVTSFFRDPESFALLTEHYLPELLARSSHREIRFWVAGCSTGEEAYSLAIAAREVMEKLGVSHDVKIFATDIDRDAILSAGGGLYPESITADVNPRLLSKYFYRKDESYQIARNIREMVVFAQHNLIKDPPFTNIDLVSCRNLLIYLQPILQKRVLEMFGFSLNTDGILFLGSSETIGEMTGTFKTVDSKHKIFQSIGRTRKASPVESFSGLGTRGGSGTMVRSRSNRAESTDDRLLARYLELLEGRYVPVSLVVNEQMEVLHVLGDTSGYFRMPTGRHTNDISKMALKDLAIPLSTGIQKVFASDEEHVFRNIKLQFTEETRNISMRIAPLPARRGQDPLVAVFLEEIDQPAKTSEGPEVREYDVNEQAQQRIADLEQELQFTKENLQATIEELETANEELQATNEELLASNEELQSTNEELQSTNEELHTVNAEYQTKILELTEMTNDVDNLLTSSNIGQLLLDENLDVRKYSPNITKVFHIASGDIGKPLSHVAHRLDGLDLADFVAHVVTSGAPAEREIQSKDERWYYLRVLPYLIGPETASGVVITLVDITSIKQTEAARDAAMKRAESVVTHLPAGVLFYRIDGRTLVLEGGNPEAERITGITVSDAVGTPFEELWPGAGPSGLTRSLVELADSGDVFRDEDFAYSDGRLAGHFRIVAFRLPDGVVAVSFEDISERVAATAALERSERRHRELFETMSQGVVYQRTDGTISSANPAAARILGLTMDELLGRTSMNPEWRATREDGTSLPGDEHPAMIALRTGKPVEKVVMGVYHPVLANLRWILVSAIPRETDSFGSEDSGVVATFDDVTELVESRQRIADYASRLDYAFSVAGYAWWDWRRSTDTVTASPRKAKFIGLGSDEVGSNLSFWTDRIHPDDYERVMGAMRDHLEGRTDRYETRYRLRHRDGSYVDLLDAGEVVERDTDGAPERLLGVVRPVETEEKP